MNMVQAILGIYEFQGMVIIVEKEFTLNQVVFPVLQRSYNRIELQLIGGPLVPGFI